MSLEFEKVVLEKLDELSKNMKETKEKVDSNATSINELTKKINQLEEKVDNNTASISTLTEKVTNNTSLISNLTEKVDKLETKVDIQGQNLANFENEFTIKVQALFDSFVSNTQSHLSFEKSIAALNAENFRQGARISKLEDYFKGSKILATN